MQETILNISVDNPVRESSGVIFFQNVRYVIVPMHTRTQFLNYLGNFLQVLAHYAAVVEKQERKGFVRVT